MRRTGLARNTIRSALRSEAPPGFRCPLRPSKLDPFKEEIHELLRVDPKLPSVRVRELIEPLGFDGGKSIVDDYLREVRPLFVRTRTHQLTVYQPGEICQWDLWETSKPVPGGHGQARRAWVVVCCLGYSTGWRRRADLLQGSTGRAVGHGPLLVVARRAATADVWDREGCLHAHAVSRSPGSQPRGVQPRTARRPPRSAPPSAPGPQLATNCSREPSAARASVSPTGGYPRRSSSTTNPGPNSCSGPDSRTLGRAGLCRPQQPRTNAVHALRGHLGITQALA
jgi:hypothetical protein